MSTIINIQKLSEILAESELLRLDAGALQHKRFSNILFDIIAVDKNVIIIITKQGRNLSGNLADDETLTTRTVELFQPFLPSFNLDVHVSPKLIPPIEDVDDAWIRKKMNKTGKQIKDIVNDTGLNKSYLSAIVNGRKPISRINKAFFYYYFETKQLYLTFFGINT